MIPCPVALIRGQGWRLCTGHESRGPQGPRSAAAVSPPWTKERKPPPGTPSWHHVHGPRWQTARGSRQDHTGHRPSRHFHGRGLALRGPPTRVASAAAERGGATVPHTPLRDPQGELGLCHSHVAHICLTPGLWVGGWSEVSGLLFSARVTVEGKCARELVLSFHLALLPGPPTAASLSPSQGPVLNPGVFCPPASIESRPEGCGPDCAVSVGAGGGSSCCTGSGVLSITASAALNTESS